MGTKNLPAKMYKSGSRHEKTLRFVFNDNSDRYISIAKALSEVNRVAYRDGLYYYISSVELQDAADGSTVDIFTLADTWLTKQSWIRGYQHWVKMNNRTSIPAAKYSDFKIRMTSGAPSGTLAVPESHGTADEWDLSKFIYDKTAENGGMGSADLYMVGNHTGSFPNITGYGLVKGYKDTRRNAGDITAADEPVPDAAQTDIMSLMGSDGHPEIVANKVDSGDLTPYDHDNFYGTTSSDLTRQFRLATGYGAGRATTIGGFCVPFGLMKVEASCDGEYSLTIKLTPGPYHGVYAERVFDDQ